MTKSWIASLALIGCTTTTAQRPAVTVLTGRVIDEENEPVTSAVIELDQTGTGAITNANGTFRILEVWPGPHTIRAQAIGYRTSVRTFEIEQGDSLDLVLRLREVHIGFAGADSPLPSQNSLGTNEALIRLLHILEQRFGDDLDGDGRVG